MNDEQSFEIPTQDPYPVARRAAHALEDKRQAEAARRAENDRIRREEEALLDAETMQWVRVHPWIRRYLPDVEWVLVDRRFPQVTAVVHPVGEPSVKLVVSSGHDDYVLLARHADDGKWLVGAHRCVDLADIGQYLAGRTRRVEEVAE